MKKKDLQDLRNKKIAELDKIVAKKRQESILAHARMKTGQEKLFLLRFQKKFHGEFKP